MPSRHNLYVDGQPVQAAAYEINGSNYFKIRDLAAVLSGTEHQFDVGYDTKEDSIGLLWGGSYTGEADLKKPTSNQTATANRARVLSTKYHYLPRYYDAYLIAGNNYFKLRDIAELQDFGLNFDESTQSVYIRTNEGYSPYGFISDGVPESTASEAGLPVIPSVRAAETPEEKEVVTVTIDGTVMRATGYSANVDTFVPTPAPIALVEIWWRPTNQMLAETVTNEEGYYSVSFEMDKWTLEHVLDRSDTYFDLRAVDYGQHSTVRLIGNTAGEGFYFTLNEPSQGPYHFTHDVKAYNDGLIMSLWYNFERYKALRVELGYKPHPADRERQ